MDVGVIGTGMMGANHARVYSNMRGVGSVYVYDIDNERANKVANDNDCLSVSSLDALFDCVDAVSVTVPTKHHYEVAKQCIEHGKHTLVEKPMCHTPEECADLCAIASANPDLVCGVGHIERFNPVVNFLAAQIKSPKYISITRHNPASSRITDSSVIEDLMIHDIDIITAFVQLKQDILPIAACGNEETYVAMIDNGFPILLSASRASTMKIREIYVIDEDRTFVGNLVDQSVDVYHKPDVFNMYTTAGVIARINIQRIEPLHVELNAFLFCIHNKQQFPISFDHGKAMVGLCNVIRKSNSKSIDISKVGIKEFKI